MLTPRGKSPLPENFPRGGSNPLRCGQRAQALSTELFRPHKLLNSEILSAEPLPSPFPNFGSPRFGASRIPKNVNLHLCHVALLRL